MPVDRVARFELARLVLLVTLLTWPLLLYLLARWQPSHPGRRAVAGAAPAGISLGLVSLWISFQRWTGNWGGGDYGTIVPVLLAVNALVLLPVGAWLVGRGLPLRWLGLVVPLALWVEFAVGVQAIALLAMGRFGYLGP